MRNRERERRAQRKRREQEIRLQMFVLAVGAALLLFLVIVGIGRWREAVAERKRLEAERALLEREEELLSDSVLEYEDLVKYYAEEEGIYEYVPVLLAIMEVETKGERDDVMQSSESAGLEPNSLGPEASIAQACDYFRGLVDRTEDLDVDRNTIIQAYNYGPGYMYYIAENGGEHSFDLAVEYAKEMSGGRTAKYTHDIAVFKAISKNSPISVLVHTGDESKKFETYKAVCMNPGSTTEHLAEIVELPKEDALDILIELDYVDQFVQAVAYDDNDYHAKWYRR